MDVVKEYKKKVVGYSLGCKEVENDFMVVGGDGM
ncbi:hypothetical protein [Bacillus mycoides]